MLLDAKAEIRLQAWGWHLAGDAACARVCDGQVPRTNKEPARGAETCIMGLKMHNARSGGLRGRWPAELTVNMALFIL